MHALAGVTAAILAGGLGTRLRPVVSDRPKSLADVGGRSCLEYLLDQLGASGLQEVVLCTGYMAGEIRAALGNSYDGMRLVYSEEPAPLGTAGALRHALRHFRSELVLAMNGDSFCEADLPAFVSWHLAQKAPLSLLLTRVSDTGRYGRVRTDASGRVTRFDEKDGTAGPGWINAGIYLLNRSALMTIPDSRPVSLEREIFPAWIGRGLYGYRSRGRFLDIGTPESYAAAAEFFGAVATAGR